MRPLPLMVPESHAIEVAGWHHGHPTESPPPSSAAGANGRRSPAQELIWTGCYTADGGGRGTGIGALRAGADGTLRWLGVAAAADSPSFLAVHPTLDVVYAVGEAARTVTAYRRSGGFGLEAGRP